MKLRQFGELLAQQLAARADVFTGVDEAQSDLLGEAEFAAWMRVHKRH